MRKRVVALLILATFLAGCDIDTEVASSTVYSSCEIEATGYEAVERFLELYEKSATHPLLGLQEMDLHGSDYRTEFRLGAFKNAVGLKGTVLDLPIEVVGYGNQNASIRVYASANSREDANQIVADIVMCMDQTISKESIAARTEKETDYCQFVLGCSNQIHGYISKDYSAGIYNIFVNCEKTSFFD